MTRHVLFLMMVHQNPFYCSNTYPYVFLASFTQPTTQRPTLFSINLKKFNEESTGGEDELVPYVRLQSLRSSNKISHELARVLKRKKSLTVCKDVNGGCKTGGPARLKTCVARRRASAALPS